jgi:hypothetical protein
MGRHRIKILILFLSVMVSSIGLIWALLSPTVEDYLLLRNRTTENNLSLAFLVALKINSESAYAMIDPRLNDRLDKWMQTHESVTCATKADLVLTGATFGKIISDPNKYHAVFACTINGNGKNHPYAIRVRWIYIKDMKVVDWDPPIESVD